VLTSNGRLWSNIAVRLLSEADVSVHQEGRLGWVLGLSKNSTLTVKVIMGQRTSSAVLPMFYAHSHRWKSFSLWATRRGIAGYFGGADSTIVLPSLQHLLVVIMPDDSRQFRFDGDEDDDEEENDSDDEAGDDDNVDDDDDEGEEEEEEEDDHEDRDSTLFSSPILHFETPNLHSVEFGKVIPSGITLQLPWEQLYHLNLCSANGSDAFDILMRCTSLRSLKLEPANRPFNIPPATVTPYPTSLSLVNLTLRVRCTTLDYSAMRVLFNSVTLPHLDTFELEGWSQGYLSDEPEIADQWPLPAFRSFVERSQCELRRLMITQVLMSDDMVISILECVSATLQVLIVEEPSEYCSCFSHRRKARLTSITDRLIDRLYLRDTTTTVSLWAPGASNYWPEYKQHNTPSAGLLPLLTHLEFSCRGEPKELNLVKFIGMIQSRIKFNRLRSVYLEPWLQSVKSGVTEELKQDLVFKLPMGAEVDITKRIFRVRFSP
jgi:hypothetical protein